MGPYDTGKLHTSEIPKNMTVYTITMDWKFSRLEQNYCFHYWYDSYENVLQRKGFLNLTNAYFQWTRRMFWWNSSRLQTSFCPEKTCFLQYHMTASVRITLRLLRCTEDGIPMFYKKNCVICYWKVFHLGDISEYACTDSKIHQHNVNVQYITLPKNLFSFLQQNKDALFWFSSLGVSLTTHLWIWLFSAPVKLKVCCEPSFIDADGILHLLQTDFAGVMRYHSLQKKFSLQFLE